MNTPCRFFCFFGGFCRFLRLWFRLFFLLRLFAVLLNIKLENFYQVFRLALVVRVVRLVKQFSDVVARAQCMCNKLRRNGNFSVSYAVKGRLNLVGKVRNCIETEHAGRAFDCVHNAENGLNCFDVFRIVFKLQKQVFKFV